MADKDLKARLRNPNKDFEALLWRPKSRFFKRLVAKYVNYIEILAYVFVVVLLTAILIAWMFRFKEWTTSDKSVDLKPAITVVESTCDGAVAQVLFVHGTGVATGTPLVRVAPAGAADTVTLAAPCDGIAYHPVSAAAFDTLHANRAVTEGDPLVQIVDFTSFTVENEYKSAGNDSINVGDSAELELVSEWFSSMLAELAIGGSAVAAQVVTPPPQAIRDELRDALKGMEVTAREQGEYRVTSVDNPQMVAVFDATPAEEACSLFTNFATIEPFYGVVSKGTRVLNVELVVPFPPQADSVMAGWLSEALASKTLSVDGVGHRLGALKSSRMRQLSLTAEAPLDSYVPYSKRSKEIRELNKKDFKVKVTIAVDNPPVAISTFARVLFEADPSKCAKVRTRVNCATTTWGRKLIRK